MPGGRKNGFAYDISGNQTNHITFGRAAITNRYDLNGRLTNILSVNNYKVSYAYNELGFRTNMVDASGSTAYRYDSQNRLTNKLVSFSGGPTAALNYAYDKAGTLTNIYSSTSGGVNLLYQYDPLSRLTNVIANGSTVASYGFDMVGNLQAMRYGNGVTNLYQYDCRNRLTNLVWNYGNSIRANFAYQLGLTGNRIGSIETVNSTHNTYAWAYDSLYRLKQETLGGELSGLASYGYDSVGNRTNRQSTVSGLSTTASTYNANDWLNSDGYDANGNTTNSTSTAYQYDVMNHLTNVNNGSIIITYDGDGNRMSKKVGGTTNYYLLDDRNPSGYVQVLEEYQGSSLTRTYNYGLDLISQKTGSVTYYFGTDGHGSTRFLLNTLGSITESYAYDAYGTRLTGPTTPATPYLYCGEQFDADLGFYYLRARYLNTDTGRFWSMDSFEGETLIPLSLHKYLYCNANPLNGQDPSGHDMADISAASLLTVGLAAFTGFALYEAQVHAKYSISFSYESASAAVSEALETIPYLADMVVAKSALIAAGTTLTLEIEKARKQQNLPEGTKVIPMPRCVIPIVAGHIASVMGKYGQPFKRVGAIEWAKNRYQAMKAYGLLNTAVTLSTGMFNLDEYPFPSCNRGGKGASVMPVPAYQNSVQGGIIGICYLLEKIGIDDPFYVVVTP